MCRDAEFPTLKFQNTSFNGGMGGGTAQEIIQSRKQVSDVIIVQLGLTERRVPLELSNDGSGILKKRAPEA